MLQVKRDLCLGCGLCAEHCPQQAISIQMGQAHIDQKRCNQCGTCLDLCTQGAIVEMTPVSKVELEDTITALKQKTNDILERIDKLTKQR